MIKKNNIFIYPLENKVIFPYHQYTFSLNSNVYQPEAYDNLIGFVTKTDQYKGVQKIQGLSKYGSLLKIHKSQVIGYKVADKPKILKYNFYGLTFARFRIVSLYKQQSKVIANIEIFSDQITKQSQSQLDGKNLITHLKKQMKIFYECKMRFHQAETKKQALDQQKSINKIIYKCIDELQLPTLQKLKFLQISRQDNKIELLLTFLTNKTQNIKSVIDLQQKVRNDMMKSNNAAKKSSNNSGVFGLGRSNSDLQQLQEKINNKNLPQNVKDQIQKELKRMGGQTQSAVSLKYIETLLQVPWNQSNEDVKDLTSAQKILHQDHTGLKQVKERILEFLAVKFRNGNSKGNILCLHGPPGVGKTSIAKSIARALNKQFTRISLGGMNDEAQLRGHRRTYVAAMPGMIIRALIRAKSNNPVILLDEIQKMGKSYKGDPEHALLQILDPSQNNSFVDHYIGIPVDLSKVMFICTANSLQLSTPLLNRLQLIEVPGYTRQQKFEIAQNHLLPLQKKENGVQQLIQFQPTALKQIIKYSRQMGVRQLQRNIAKICRKTARKGKNQKINIEKVHQILGDIKQPQYWDGIGVVNGMAWTEMGGKLMLVQSIKFPALGKPKIQVTGQLGDVMKESINIALSWIKANKTDFALWGGEQAIRMSQQIDQLDKTSLHLHFPQGGIKKDGPSAGVTIVTCLVSLLSKVPVRSNLSMTGQITLSGRVLPVGGIRQKCIAAIYEGVKHIIIPFGNMKDLEKIPMQLKKKVNFYGVKTIREVLTIAFPAVLDKAPPKL